MIGIIAAMDQEVDAMKVLMTEIEEKKVASYTFFTGKMGDKHIVLMKSGVGKVLAASATTVLVTNFDVKLVINIGTAGSLKKWLEPLDVVVGGRIANADFDLTCFGYQRSFEEKKISFHTDQVLSSLIVANNIQVYHGDMISTDTFIAQQVQLENLLKLFPSALCADMEAGAIATVLSHYQIPFLIIRSISDYVLADNNQTDFIQNIDMASRNSAIITKDLIKKIK